MLFKQAISYATFFRSEALLDL